MFDNHSKPDRQKWRSGFIFVKNSPILGELERNGNKKPSMRHAPRTKIYFLSTLSKSLLLGVDFK